MKNNKQEKYSITNCIRKELLIAEHQKHYRENLYYQRLSPNCQAYILYQQNKEKDDASKEKAKEKAALFLKKYRMTKKEK